MKKLLNMTSPYIMLCGIVMLLLAGIFYDLKILLQTTDLLTWIGAIVFIVSIPLLVVEFCCYDN